MKTYLRIFEFASSLGKYVPQYIIFTFFGIIFGLINFILLKPLFEVIFRLIDPVQLSYFKALPEFDFSLKFIEHFFYHHFIQFSEEMGEFGSLIYVCIVIAIANFLSNIFKYLSQVISAIIRANIIKNLRDAVYDKISQLHIGFFTNERKGDLISRITNDVQEVERSVMYVFQVAFKEPVTIIVYFTALFIMSAKLTLFTIIMLPIAGSIISSIAKRLKKSATASQESLGRILNIVEESLSGMRVIKAFTARKHMTDRFQREDKKYTRINISMAKKYELASPLSEFLGVITISGILLYGGSLILNEGFMEPANFLTYLVIFSQILTPAKEISKAVTSIQRGSASAERIFAITDLVPEIKSPANPIEKGDFKNAIELKNVSFAYEKDKKILHNINLKVEKGKTIALVGPSGGGKSTIADLVPRFYDPSKGDLFLDNVNIKDIKLESLRKLMGIVTQESILFNDTVLNNIAFGIENAVEEDVIKAAKIANAHDFIMNMDDGYQTEIGERGTKLSGGQRQRLSIARAVFKNPPILILDEATSALDSESEKLVQEALTNLMKNRTSIVIAHRLSTIQHASEILVIKDGEIIERGTHEELLQQAGLYNKLIEMQTV